LVSQAKLFAYEDEIEHNKFLEFLYYQAVAKYDDELFPLYINVGKALNDKKYHIYDITKKLRDTANRINGLEQPSIDEGDTLESDISDDNISQNTDSVNREFSEIKKIPLPNFQMTRGKEFYSLASIIIFHFPEKVKRKNKTNVPKAQFMQFTAIHDT
jgi:hypothetical protein